MCGCGGDQTSKSEATTSVPQRIMDAYYGLMDRAVTQSNQPYQAYTGQRVAGFSPDQDAAFQKVRDAQGIGQPYVDAAFSAARSGAGPVTWQDVEAAYNPAIDAQVGRLQNDFATQNAREMASVDSRATQIGAVTGSRNNLVARTLAQESQRRQQDPVIAQARSDAYNRAWQGAEGNRDAAARGAQIYSTLGQQAQGMAGEDIQRLLATGGLQQQNQQANNDWGYQQYQQQQAYPYQNLAFALPFTQAGAGLASTSTQTQTQPDSTMGNVLGLGATVLGGWLSDERAKENIVEIGKTHDGQTIYRYNYIGDPTTQIGLIAQEVEQSHPEAVGEAGGLKTVNYDLATRDAALPMEHKAHEGGFAYGGSVATRMPGDQSNISRMMAGLGDAVTAIRGQMQSSPGYAEGGFVVPRVQPVDLGSATYVPQVSFSPTSPMTAHASSPASHGQGDSQMWGNLNKGASAFGKWLQPKGDVGLGSWAPTVTMAARGGRIDEDPISAMMMPSVKPDSAFSGPLVHPFYAKASNVPGVVLEGVDTSRPGSDVKSYDAKPIQDLGGAYVPAPISASVSPVQTLAAPLPSSDQKSSPAWYEPHEGKGWLESDSNPDLGVALAQAGAAMMGNRGSLFQKLGRGVGTGVGTYLSNAEAVREEARKNREADLKSRHIAEELATRRAEHTAKLTQMAADNEHRQDVLGETRRHNMATEGRGGSEQADIAKYNFAVKHGYTGTPVDFWRDEHRRTSESTLTREEAKKAVASVDRMREQADGARTGLANVAQMRALRSKVGYEGGMLNETRTAIGKKLPILSILPGIPSAEEAGSAEAIGSLATQMQLDFTNATKGAISDAEMRLFGLATPGMSMTDPGANQILDGMEAGYERVKERSKFYQSYLKNHKSLAGADETWDQYVAANPILSQDKKGNVIINKTNIGNWKNFVGPGDDDAASPVPRPAGAPSGARQAPDGNWYVDDPDRPGKFLKVVP